MRGRHTLLSSLQGTDQLLIKLAGKGEVRVAGRIGIAVNGPN